MIQLTLLTREGCHLCDRMKAVVAKACETHPILLHEIDISTNQDLEKKFGMEIPVLMIKERVIASSRISVSSLLAWLDRIDKKNG